MRTASPERIARCRERGWWGDHTAWTLFRAAVDGAPDAPALLDPPNRESFARGAPARLSWSALDARVSALRAYFAAAGVGEGAVVVMQLPNTVESVASYLALAALGAVVSPAPMQYGVHELRGIALLVQPVAYLSTRAFRDEDFLATRAAAFAPEVLLLDPAAAVAGGVVPPPAAVSADEVFTLCWTSGTTGTPKGVPRSHNQWLAQSLAMIDTGIEPGMTMLCPFPLVNMASLSGFFFPWLQQRCTLVLHHPLDLPVFLRQLQDERVAYTVVPPALLEMLLRKRELLAGVDLSALRLVASGSAPLSPWMVRTWQEEFGIGVINIFGSNEGLAFASGPRDVPDPERRATLFPRFGVDGIDWSNRIAARMRTRLADPASGEHISAPGVPGEMQIAGPNVIDGYFAAPETDRKVFTADGFFRTGDLFEIAGSGEDSRYYRFLGRCKDLINRGGMKISPEELDTLLAAHPKIAEAAVCGYPDAVLGERIRAVVVPRPGETLTLEELVAFLEECQVARFKLPEQLVLVEALPRNPLGKVQRAALGAAGPA
jgi:acyl-CoA synthetase (AMP-forming)/AMP-acid ligase II